ncbi:hypothetical protein [Fervidobacterium gondwanense]|nr:hypothetical protein [Fervidobacterium gondwanense]
METRTYSGGVRIERSIKIRWIGTCAWIVLIQSVILAFNFLGIYLPDRILNEQSKEMIEKWYSLPRVGIKSRNISVQIRTLVSTNLVKFGIAPDYSINFESTTTEYLFEQEDASSTNVKYLGVLEVTENVDEIALNFGEKSYVLPKEIFVENASAILKSIFNVDIHREKAEDLKTIVFIPNSEILYVSSYGKIPIIVVEDKLNFYEHYITIDGSTYRSGVLTTTNSRQIQVEEIPILLSTNFLMTKSYTISLGTKKYSYNQSVPVFGWNKIILYSDGSITDTTLSWRLKVSNTPLDFLLNEDRFYVLDISGNVYSVNLKTRKVNHLGGVEGAFKFSKHGSDVFLCSQNLCYHVRETSLEKVDQHHIEESEAHFFYPSISSLQNTGFGVFLGKTFLGNELIFIYVLNDKLRILTDVGTWEVFLKE